MSFDPDTGLLYLPAAESSTFYAPTKDYKYDLGLESIGVDLDAATHGAPSSVRICHHGRLPAGLEPRDLQGGILRAGLRRRRTDHGGQSDFPGSIPRRGAGYLRGLRATDGKALWSWNTPDAMAGGPVTYLAHGEQYVAVISGALFYSGTATPRMRHNGRMLAFKLNGVGDFPPDALPAPPPNPPAQIASASQVALGGNVFDKRCGLCHGFGAVSPNIIPDLRRSAFLTSPEGWQAVVIGGALAPRGMISWKEYVSPAQAEGNTCFCGGTGAGHET